jgi:hypothetical protein
MSSSYPCSPEAGCASLVEHAALRTVARNCNRTTDLAEGVMDAFAALETARVDVAAVRQISDPRIRRIAVLVMQSSSSAQPQYRAALHALDPLIAAEVDGPQDLADA